APVSDVAVPQARGRVEVAPAVVVLEPRTLAAHEDEFTPRHPRHVGKGMPEPLWVLVHARTPPSLVARCGSPWQPSAPSTSHELGGSHGAVCTRSLRSGAVAPAKPSA